MDCPTGLKNILNSCFLNSCLQCLGSLSTLNSYFTTKVVTFNPKSKKNGFVSVLFTRYILSVREGTVFEPLHFLVSPFFIFYSFLFVIINVFIKKNKNFRNVCVIFGKIINQGSKWMLICAWGIYLIGFMKI